MKELHTHAEAKAAESSGAESRKASERAALHAQRVSCLPQGLARKTCDCIPMLRHCHTGPESQASLSPSLPRTAPAHLYA